MDRRGSFGVKRSRPDDGTASTDETVPKRSDSRAEDASDVAGTVSNSEGSRSVVAASDLPVAAPAVVGHDVTGNQSKAPTATAQSEHPCEPSSSTGFASFSAPHDGSTAQSSTPVYRSSFDYLQSSHGDDGSDAVDADVLVSRMCESLIAGNVEKLASSMGECYLRICGSDQARFSVWLSNDVDALITAIPHAFSQFTPGHLACAALLCAIGFPLVSFMKIPETSPPLQFLMLLRGYGLDLGGCLTPALNARDVPVIVWLIHHGAAEHSGTANLFRRYVERLVQESQAAKSSEPVRRGPLLHPGVTRIPQHLLDNVDEDMISNDWEEVPGSGHPGDDEVVDIAFDQALLDPSPVRELVVDSAFASPSDGNSGGSTSSSSSSEASGDSRVGEPPAGPVTSTNPAQAVVANVLPPVPRLQPVAPVQFTSPDTPHRVSTQSSSLREYLAAVSALSPDAENTPRTRGRQIAREVVRAAAPVAPSSQPQRVEPSASVDSLDSIVRGSIEDFFANPYSNFPEVPGSPVPHEQAAVVFQLNASQFFGGAKERASAARQAEVRELSSQLTLLEMNLRWSAMERFWGAENGAFRNVWRTTLRSANSPENVATAVRELENALKWDAMMPVWAGVRREWLQQIERENVTVAQVASCILTMVSNMKRTAFIHVFKFDEYTAKLRNLMSGASSGYSASKEMSPESQDAVIPAPFLRCLIRTLLDHIGLRFHHCSYFHRSHVAAREALCVAESLAFIYLRGLPLTKPDSSHEDEHEHRHPRDAGRHHPDTHYVQALRWLYEAVPSQVLRILFSSGDPLVSDWMHDEGPNSRTKAWSEAACIESWAAYSPTPVLGPIVIDDLSSNQPMLVECVAMLIGSDPESFLAGAVSPAPTGDRTTADKSHSLVRFLTLLSTGLSPLSHSAEKLLISAICRILEACHHASPNCCKCHASGTTTDCKLWQCVSVLLLLGNLLRNAAQSRLDSLMEDRILECVEPIYALYLHCGSHTPVTRGTILSLLLSLKSCKGDMPSYAAMRLLKCRRVDVDGVLLLPPAILRVAIHLWDVPMSKEAGKAMGSLIVKELATLLPQLFDAVGPQGQAKSSKQQQDEETCITNTSPSLSYDVQDVRNELGRASVFGMVLCVASYYSDLLLEVQPATVTKKRRSSVSYDPEVPNRLRVGPVVGAPSHVDRVIEIDRMRAEVREQYMSRYAGLRRDGRLREAANDMDELLDFAFSEGSHSTTCTDPSHEGNTGASKQPDTHRKETSPPTVEEKLALFEEYKRLVAPDWFLQELCDRLEVPNAKSKEMVAVDSLEFMTTIQPVVKLMCVCPANAKFIFARVESGLSRHLATGSALMAVVCEKFALSPLTASHYDIPNDDPDFVALHPTEESPSVLYAQFQALLGLVSQHVKCALQCFKHCQPQFSEKTSAAVCKSLRFLESVFASLGGIHRVMKSLKIGDFGSRSASVAFLASPIVTYVMLFTSQLWSLVSAADRGSVEDPLHDVTANAEYDATLHTAVAYDLKNVATGRPKAPIVDSDSKMSESELDVLESKDDDDVQVTQPPFAPPLLPVLRRFLIRACRSYLTDVLVSDANASDVKFHLGFLADSASFAVPFEAKVKWFRKRIGAVASEPLFGRIWLNESNEPRTVGPEDPLFQFGGVPQTDPLYPPLHRTRPATRRNAMIPIRRDPPASVAPAVEPPVTPPLPPPPVEPQNPFTQAMVQTAATGRDTAQSNSSQPVHDDIGELPIGCVPLSTSAPITLPDMLPPPPPPRQAGTNESLDTQRHVRIDPTPEVGEPSDLVRARVRRLSLMRVERARREASERSTMLDFDSRMPPPPSFVSRNRSSRISVRRDALLADSFERFKLPDSAVGVAQSMTVQFVGEDASGPGLVREWLHLVCSELTDPAQGLFQPVGGSCFIEPVESPACEDWEQKYAFAGRVFGLALVRQQCVAAHLSTPVFALLAGHPITLRDVDAGFASSMRFILNNDVTDLHLSFPEACSTPHADVTNANKLAYVTAQLHATLGPIVHAAVSRMREGLIEVVPPELLKMFTGVELRALLCGPWDIDVDDWQRNTVYGNIDENGPIVKWFWEAVRSFTPKEKADLLRFVTGSPRPPLAGFGALPGGSGDTVKFQISCSYKGPENLPTAQTCFNQLKLSHRYTSYEQLRASLLLAVAHGKDRFTLM